VIPSEILFQKMSQKIFITSGGTGGHIIPARCLAKYLSRENQKVFFFGDKKIAGYINVDDGFKSRIISSSQIVKSPIKLFFAAIKISFGILQSLFFFLIFRPKYVVAFGGYASFPILVAAVITKTKIILHEQNSHLGKVNRIFAKYAEKIALSFVETSGISEAQKSKIIFTGNPVREEILALHKIPYILPSLETEGLRTDNKMGYNVLLASDFHQTQKPKPVFNILVIGGSGGAKIFSEILPKAFFNLSASLKDFIHITQQCRKELKQFTFEQYKSFNLSITIDTFFNNMPELITTSHLVIARSGSSSIFEFCAAKKPMILIPFAAAADNHQEKNAEYMEKNGAAIVIRENEFTINHVNEVLKKLIDSPAILKKMSENAAALAVLDATKNLASLVS
jgi:UDP-N-acetylglucosamine--N-acetylmuramyl-(pentapeptide) pyrophosphoryl-undecaprenol N-acetylglucosamine transferase